MSIRKTQNEITGSFYVPEPTRSLIFVTDEDLSKMENPMSITVGINISLTNEGVKAEVHQKENGFYAEPSLIWTKLPVQPNDEHVTNAMYYPSYSAFYPKTRYEYLCWLKDITQDTNLSYVFLYFYGLERHLLIGDYDKAAEEVLRLLKHHSKQSFKYYAAGSLVAASIARNRLDILDRAPWLLEVNSDEILAVKIKKGMKLEAEQLMDLASWVGFSNRRYIKQQPKLFMRQLEAIQDREGDLLSRFKLNDFEYEEAALFANMSIPDRYRKVKLPIILRDPKFQQETSELLTKAHNGVKETLIEKRKSLRKQASQ